MRKGLAPQKLLIYFYASGSLVQHLHTASSPPFSPSLILYCAQKWVSIILQPMAMTNISRLFLFF